MKKIIAYIAMAAIIAALLTACGDGRITDNTVTSPRVTPEVNTDVTPGVVSPNVSGQVSPNVTNDPNNGVVGDIEDMFEGENKGRNDMTNSPAVTAKP